MRCLLEEDVVGMKPESGARLLSDYSGRLLSITAYSQDRRASCKITSCRRGGEMLTLLCV